jgi:hypothetical protein
MKPSIFYTTTAWKYCSKYVLLYFSLDGLMVKCSTCGSVLQITERTTHCGHLIKITDSWATAFEFTNLAPQCYRCNHYYGGRPDLMKEFLTSRHGEKEIEKLYIKKHNYCKLDIVSLTYWKNHYKELFDNMVNQKGNPWKKENRRLKTI